MMPIPGESTNEDLTTDYELMFYKKPPVDEEITEFIEL